MDPWTAETFISRGESIPIKDHTDIQPLFTVYCLFLFLSLFCWYCIPLLPYLSLSLSRVSSSSAISPPIATSLSLLLSLPLFLSIYLSFSVSLSLPHCICIFV